jgi:hypothetical protein
VRFLISLAALAIANHSGPGTISSCHFLPHCVFDKAELSERVCKVKGQGARLVLFRRLEMANMNGDVCCQPIPPIHCDDLGVVAFGPDRLLDPVAEGFERFHG